MKNKKFLFPVFIIMLILGLSISANADEPIICITLPNTLPSPGDEFDIKLDIDGNPGFSSFMIIVDYNDSALECISIDVGDAVSGMLTATNEKATISGVNARIAGAGSATNYDNGTVSVFHFKVLENTTPMLCLSTVSFSLKSEQVDFKVKYIYVSGDYGDNEYENYPIILPDIPNPDNYYPFSDVSATHWARDLILNAYRKGLIEGKGNGYFAPDEFVTRAEFVTMLWRMEGSQELASSSDFMDVDPSSWYYKQICWAAENNYINGISDTEFDPDGLITREQICTILFRLSGGISGQELLFSPIYDSSFLDSGKISSFAKPSVYWAYYNNILFGISRTELAPQTSASRAQVAAVLLRYLDKF